MPKLLSPPRRETQRSGWASALARTISPEARTTSNSSTESQANPVLPENKDNPPDPVSGSEQIGRDIYLGGSRRTPKNESRDTNATHAPARRSQAVLL